MVDATVIELGFQYNPDEQHSQIQIMEQNSEVEAKYPQVIWIIQPGTGVELGFGQEGDRFKDSEGNEWAQFGGQLDLALQFQVTCRSTVERKRLSDLVIRAVLRKLRPAYESNMILYKNAFTFGGFKEQEFTGGIQKLYISVFNLPIRVSWRDFEPLDPNVPKSKLDVETVPVTDDISSGPDVSSQVW